MTKYNLYLHDEDTLILKYKVWTDDVMKLYNQLAKPCLVNALRKGFSLEFQAENYERYMKNIQKRKFDCYKIRRTDIELYLCCYLALYKMKKLKSYNDMMILKIKKKK
jgi:hypothetical protein